MHEAVDAVARIYTERVHKFRRNEEGSIDLWIFVVPEIVYERCRPESRRTGLTLVAGKTPKKQRARSPQPFLLMDERFDPRIEDVFDDIPDFRRHIKATLGGPRATLTLTETCPAIPKALGTQLGRLGRGNLPFPPCG